MFQMHKSAWIDPRKTPNCAPGKPRCPFSRGWQCGGHWMPGVTVKDVNHQEFVRALAAFLRKSGKPKVPEWVDTVKLAKHEELAPYHENWRYTRAYSLAPAPPGGLWGQLQDQDLHTLEGLQMMEKDQDGGCKLTPQGQRENFRTGGRCQQEAEQMMLG